jgi:hypothetical protein
MLWVGTWFLLLATVTYLGANRDHQMLLNLWALEAEPAVVAESSVVPPLRWLTSTSSASTSIVC